ncbi:hypothetical protein QVD99_000126 [Batrachochytrium dendrobatidis]|nr:hypothetical protein QVD99_000126 [Batrachochytrium dendrobatidis]
MRMSHSRQFLFQASSFRYELTRHGLSTRLLRLHAHSMTTISSATQSKPLPNAFPTIQGVSSMRVTKQSDTTAGLDFSSHSVSDRSARSNKNVNLSTEFQVINTGLGSVLHVALASTEPVLAAVGTVTGSFGNATSELTVGAPMRDAVLRRLAGGSLFFEKFSVTDHDHGIVILTPKELGDIATVELDGSSEFIIRQSALLAATSNLEVGLSTGGFGLADSGFFNYTIGGKGTLAMTAYGGLVQILLEPGQEAIVNPKHMVAWDSSMSVSPLVGDAFPMTGIQQKPTQWLQNRQIPDLVKNAMQQMVYGLQRAMQFINHQVRYWVIGQRGSYRLCGPGHVFLSTRLRPAIRLPLFVTNPVALQKQATPVLS